MAFLPKTAADQKECQKRLETIIEEEGQKFLGWRTVPTNDSMIGETAKSSEPVVKQFFVGRSSKLQDDMAFERKLYVIRKRAEAGIRYSNWKGGYSFYICSLSVSHDRLQGHADFQPGAGVSFRISMIRRSNPRWRSCIPASAQIPSRVGTARIHTAISRIMGKSSTLRGSVELDVHASGVVRVGSLWR